MSDHLPSPEIKPCPFCGDEAVERMFQPDNVGTGLVGCLGNIWPECPLVDVEISIEKWSRRAPIYGIKV